MNFDQETSSEHDVDAPPTLLPYGDFQPSQSMEVDFIDNSTGLDIDIRPSLFFNEALEPTIFASHCFLSCDGWLLGDFVSD
mmetsp:Transcript_6427/g.9669  ORF Transcript_6427/g.9669 Transcript_6427/m.9669 type:complete len:81 (-) Transcript_6427:1656-1898(-)